MFDLIVKDNFVSNTNALREDVLARGFKTVLNPGDGLEYKGVQVRDPLEFKDALKALVGFPVVIRNNVARIHYKAEGGDNAIHADFCMGEFAAVLYLTPPNALTGTAFWQDKQTGWEEMPAEFDTKVATRLSAQASDESKWRNSGFIAARPGRLITYPTKRFHSRYPFTAFGETTQTARLVITLFYDKA